EAQSLLHSISTEIDRVTSLTEEYLQFSRLPESQLLKGDINRLIEDLIEFMRHEVRHKKIEVEYEIKEKSLQVKFDPVQLRRALLNMIRNAIDAMPKGGKLRIVIERADGNAIIHIQDNGVGISQEQLERIFDPFFTTKDFGTGLGLAVVQQIIDEHRGQISCHSRVGQGTTFSIYLPLT
ncbi:ATP-binding protein, partial [candidate division KSB1 bacterium]|nr:ATP-binding protein [candidate division KSB1 bacterium]